LGEGRGEGECIGSLPSDVAQKRRRKKQRWFRLVLLFILTPLLVWCLAFLLWLYADDIIGLFTRNSKSAAPPPKAVQKSPRAEPSPKNKSDEKILDEDRKKLDEIIKGRE
jgi:hypothetical protein